MSISNDGLKDVVGIGNAIVDVLSHADEEFLEIYGLSKAAMILVDATQAANIYTAMSSAVERSGGSVANTMAGLAALGGTGTYIGKVRNDRLGGLFRTDMGSMGLTFITPPASEGPPTARCLIIVTPDGQRSMATNLGISLEMSPKDVTNEAIQYHRIAYLEGYLWDSPKAKAAMIKAAQLCRTGGNRVALTLSDSFCVERHRGSFRDLIDRYVDILFANEEEIMSLYQVEEFDIALQSARTDCDLVVITRGEKGSVIATGESIYVINAIPVGQVVDTTGAGDLYAAGFLFGITHGFDLPTSGRIGAIAASEIISHIGARPEADLSALMRRMLEADSGL